MPVGRTSYGHSPAFTGQNELAGPKIRVCPVRKEFALRCVKCNSGTTEDSLLLRESVVLLLRFFVPPKSRGEFVGIGERILF
jgi:hypothetical protein